MIASYEIILKNAEAGDGYVDRVLKLKLQDYAKLVELAASHFSPAALEIPRSQGIGQDLEAGRIAAREEGVGVATCDGPSELSTTIGSAITKVSAMSLSTEVGGSRICRRPRLGGLLNYYARAA